ncbi:MAG: VWA domain-containing protein [Gemmatimonadaceae bacterium]
MIPLALLAPIFLAAAAAVIVPLLVHLVHKEKKEALAFPSLMFIRRTPYPFSSRQRIRDWLLFLARCAVIALAALAFSRPVLSRTPSAATDTRRGTEVVMLLDRSFSMRYANRWARAKAEALTIINALDAADRLTVIPFDRRAAAVNDPTGDKNQLRAAIDSITPGDESTRLAPAITLASRVLGGSELPKLRVVVISDFQRSSWDLTDEITLPPGTEIRPVDVSGAVSDRSVRSVEVRRDAGGDASRVSVSARIVKLGAAERGIGARLEVEGREVARSTVDVPRDGGATVSFGAIPVPSRAVAARIAIDGDELTGDDEFNFLLSRPPTVPVLVVEHGEALPERGIFLTRALEIGDAPSFDVLVRRSDRATAADLAERRVVILADAGVPPGIGAARLDAHVRAGGGLINVLGERSSARTWPGNGKALVPGEIANPTDRLGERGAVLGFIDRGHQALAVFSGARSGDLSAARFFRYRAIDTTERVLARFDDGSAALTEHQLGRGRILTWGSSFDGYWNDLPRQPVFLPFVHQLVRYAAAYRDQKRYYAVGESVQPVDVAGAGTTVANARWSIVTPSKKRLGVGGEGNPATLDIREAGIYEIRPSGVPNAEPRLLAANIAPDELDFQSFDVLRLTNALAPSTSTTASAAPDPQQLLTEREQRQSLWWYILAVTAAILLVEGILARRASANRLEPV